MSEFEPPAITGAREGTERPYAVGIDGDDQEAITMLRERPGAARSAPAGKGVVCEGGGKGEDEIREENRAKRAEELTHCIPPSHADRRSSGRSSASRARRGQR